MADKLTELAETYPKKKKTWKCRLGRHSWTFSEHVLPGTREMKTCAHCGVIRVA